MITLSLYTFSGITKLVFVQTHKPNGYVTIADRDNNSMDIHKTYITDLTNNPELHTHAVATYNYANFN